MKTVIATTPDKDKKFIEISIEMKNKFFFHWAILAGATLTLIIPFLIEENVLKKTVGWLLEVKIAIGLLVISLITASIRNLISARQIEIIGNCNLEKNSYLIVYFSIIDKVNHMSIFLSIIEFASIISYCGALTILYFFVTMILLG